MRRSSRALITTLVAASLACGSCQTPAPEAPSIKTQPTGAALTACDTAQLRVVAQGAEPLSYQWLKNGVPIEGAIQAEYSIPALDASDAGDYVVVVSNAVGSTSSAPATITVSVPPPASGPTTLTNESAGCVTVQGGMVVWSYAGYLHATSARCPGTVQHLVDGHAAPAELLTLNGLVVWLDGNAGSQGIFATSPLTGKTVLLAQTAFEYSGMAAAHGYLFWIDLLGANVQWMPQAGGDVTSVSIQSPSGHSRPAYISVDDAFIYWSDLENRVINRMAVGGGPITQLAADQGILGRTAADGENVFWISQTEIGPDQASILRTMNRSGGVIKELARQQPGSGSTLLLDGAFVYWAVDPALFPGGQAGVGRLYRVPKDGSAPAVVVADNLGFPGAMFIDGPFLYWGEYSIGGSRHGVMRILKP